MPSGVVGVLLLVLGLFAIAGGLWVLVKYLELKKRTGQTSTSGGELGPETGPATPAASDGPPPAFGRDSLLDDASEARFYQVLEAAVAQVFGAEACRVMVQIPLCQLVQIDRRLPSNVQTSWRNRIDRKRVDYVVCAAGTLKPMFVVELDGASHDGAKRKERDGFVERVLGAAGVKLVRFDRRGREWGVGQVGEKLAQG